MPNTRIVATLILANASHCLASDAMWKVRLDGIGPIKVGMSLNKLNDALHSSFQAPQDKDEQTCYFVEPEGHTGLGVMILGGHVARVDVDASNISTVEGVRNGASEAHVRAVYGSGLKVSPNYYDPESHYLTLLSPHGSYAIRFETSHGRISRYYAGQTNAIAMVEGCS